MTTPEAIDDLLAGMAMEYPDEVDELRAYIRDLREQVVVSDLIREVVGAVERSTRTVDRVEALVARHVQAEATQAQADLLAAERRRAWDGRLWETAQEIGGSRPVALLTGGVVVWLLLRMGVWGAVTTWLGGGP